MRNISFQGTFCQVELQFAHYVDTRPCFCFDIIDVLVPVAVAGEDETKVFVRSFFVVTC